MPIIPEVVEEQKLGHNPPHLVMIHDKIIVCFGCEIPVNRKDRKEPNNLVFKYMMFQTRPNGQGKKGKTNLEVLVTSMPEIWGV